MAPAAASGGVGAADGAAEGRAGCRSAKVIKSRLDSKILEAGLQETEELSGPRAMFRVDCIVIPLAPAAFDY